jgi:hypothetical protein
MRSIAVLLTLVMVSLFVVRVDAIAGSLQYNATTGGVDKADAAVKSVGKLSTPSGKATLTGDKLDIIFGNSDLTQKELIGTTINVHKTDHHTFEGIVFFTGGSANNQLGGNHGVVGLNDGSTYEGNITGVDETNLTVDTPTGQVQIPNHNVKFINSTHAFKFTIPFTGEPTAGTTTNITFTDTGSLRATTTTMTSTGKQTVTTHHTGDHHITRKKVVIAIITALLIATAIAVPVAVACGTHGHPNATRLAIQQQQVKNFLASRSSSTTTTTTTSSSSGP